eukprot:11155807-Ditylum_brightwellii.AAC.1
MQSVAQELNYGTGIVNHANTMDTIGIQDQTVDALQALATTTSDDRYAVANLSHTNVMLNNQVANLSKKVTKCDKQVDELCKSIADLTVTIRQLANNNTYS